MWSKCTGHSLQRVTGKRAVYRLWYLVGTCGMILLYMTLGACDTFQSMQHPSQGNNKAVNVSVRIDPMASRSTSMFAPGISYVDTSLFSPWDGNNAAAVSNARALLHNSVSFMNVHIMGWGADDPWPDPTQPEPENWSTLDNKLQIALNAHAQPVLTLCEAPWWMKGRMNADSSTTLLTSQDDFADIAYESRVLDNKMQAWLHLVRRVAERYMVAPYNVRYFQVWNELKGYFNPIDNDWDVNTSAGNPFAPTARHGYTYMYNLVYKTLKDVAQEKGIDPSTIQVGGPYVPMNTWSSRRQSHPSTLSRDYGIFDQRSLDAVTSWLQQKVGAEFITVDGSNQNDDGVMRIDSFTSVEKFSDVITWIRSLNNAIYPGAKTLPIWWAEWYVDPDLHDSPAYATALRTYALMTLIKAGGATALSWGSNDLWTATSSDNGGLPLPWYTTFKAFNNYFGPGTPLYKTVSSSSMVEALAAPHHTMLLNKSAFPLIVNLFGSQITLQPYEVRVVPTPSLFS